MPAPVGLGNAIVARPAIKGPSANELLEGEIVNGKRNDSPAHRARAEIATADRGEVAPANLHGKLTSAIARGIDITSLLTLQAVEMTDTETPDPEAAPAPEADEGSSDESAALSSTEEASVPAEDEATVTVHIENIVEELLVAPTDETNLVDVLSESLDDEAA